MKRIENTPRADETQRYVIEGPKRFPRSEVIAPLPKEADPQERARRHSERWLMDVLAGIERPKYEEDQASTRKRVLETLKIKTMAAFKFIGGHIPLDASAFLLQTFIMKPGERDYLMRALMEKRTVSEQVANIESAINVSEHLTALEGTALLEKIWGLSDSELAEMKFGALLESTLLPTEYTLDEERAFSDEATHEIARLIKESVRSRVDGKKLLIDILMVVAIAKGGVLLKPLGKGAKVAYYSIKALKGAKVMKGARSELRGVWKKPKPKPGEIASAT